MPLGFHKAAILGATGPTGKALARELAARGLPFRAVSRNENNLRAAFMDSPAEIAGADVLTEEGARRAVEGCDLVFQCLGLPADQIDGHPVSARHVVKAAAATGARCVHVSSYWAYLPAGNLPLTEDHPRTGGPPYVQKRREAEDIFQQAGAAVVHLPDFYGPEVHTSTLQNALLEAAAGKTINWAGSPKTGREYVYVPDAMKASAALATHPEAYGERWIVPGAGPIPIEKIAAIASGRLGRPVRVRGAGMFMLRLLSLFMSDLRSFAPMLPFYVQPVSYDGSKLRSLIGEIPITPYEQGVARTLDSL